MHVSLSQIIGVQKANNSFQILLLFLNEYLIYPKYSFHAQTKTMKIKSSKCSRQSCVGFAIFLYTILEGKTGKNNSGIKIISFELKQKENNTLLNNC